MKRRLFAAPVVLAVVVLLLIPACSITSWPFGKQEGYVPAVPLDPEAPIEEGVTYEIDLLVPRLPLWAHERSYEAEIGSILEQFRQVRPQVTANVSFASLLDLSNALQEQVATSANPLVVLNLYGPMQPLTDPAPLPVTRFIEGSQGAYWPVALAAVSGGANVWGWPSWLEAEFLIATETAIEQTPIDEVYQLGTGWTPAELRKMLGAVSAKPALVSLGPPVQLFSSFVVAAGGPCLPFDAALTFQWTGEQLSMAATQLAELSTQGLLVESADLHRGILDSVYNQRIGFVTGVGPWALNHAHRQGRASLLRVLPLPTGRTQPATPVKTASFQVYRGSKSDSAAHYRLANELARYLASELGPWVADTTFAFPAVQGSLERWAQQRGAEWSTVDPDGWGNIELAIAWTLATGCSVNAATPEQARLIDSYRSDVLGPALNDLLDGTTDVPRFVERVTNGASNE